MTKKITDPIELARLNKDFPITSVCRMDLLNKEVGFTAKQALDITDAQMKKIASKLADDYCNQLFWSSLKIVAESSTDDG
jgi:hypothetical protein